LGNQSQPQQAPRTYSFSPQLLGKLSNPNKKKRVTQSGNPTISLKPVAFRPCLTAGLALTLYFLPLSGTQ
jgi:hypothetical protein